jgi:hypothetical protein
MCRTPFHTPYSELKKRGGLIRPPLLLSSRFDEIRIGQSIPFRASQPQKYRFPAGMFSLSVDNP